MKICVKEMKKQILEQRRERKLKTLSTVSEREVVFFCSSLMWVLLLDVLWNGAVFLCFLLLRGAACSSSSSSLVVVLHPPPPPFAWCCFPPPHWCGAAVSFFSDMTCCFSSFLWVVLRSLPFSVVRCCFPPLHWRGVAVSLFLFGFL